MNHKFFRLVARLIAASWASTLGANGETSRGIQREEVISVVRLFEEVHYNHGPASDLSRETFIRIFLGKLDPEHAVFTDEAIGAIDGKYRKEALRAMSRKGDISAAFAINEIFTKYVQERAAWVAARLANWISSQSDDVSPPSQLNWAPNRESLDFRWEQRLRHEWAIEQVRGAIADESLNNLRAHYKALFDHLAARSDDDVSQLFLNAFAATYDRRSTYFSPDGFADTFAASSGKVVGIGALFNFVDLTCTFEDVFAGGPSAASGSVKTGDRLLAVQPDEKEFVDIAGLGLRQVADLTRGEEGSKVGITVEHPYSLTRETIHLTRARITPTRARAFAFQVRDAKGKMILIGVVSLPSLYGEMTDQDRSDAEADVRACLDRLESQRVKGVVLDLRGNGGGLLSEAIQVAGLFIGNKPILRVKNYIGGVKIDSAVKISKINELPLTVLVDSKTASGAEMVAGALQAYGRAVVVGSPKTAGSGSVQTFIELRNMPNLPRRSATKTGALKITVQQCFLPNGDSTEVNGITPDIVLPEAPCQLPLEVSSKSTPTRPEKLEPLISPRDNFKTFLTTLRTQSERRQSVASDLLYLRKFSEEWARYPANPSGDMNSLLEWLRGREALKKRFDAEGRTLAKDTPQKIEVHAEKAGVDRTLSAKDSHATDDVQPVDVVLQEGLRVVVDQIAAGGTDPRGSGR